VASNISTAKNIERLKQAFKIGLAAALSYYLARFLGLPESYWAPISAIIVMYSDVSKTVKASAYRLIGTAIGVTIGAATAALFGIHLWSFGLAVTLTVLICAFLGFEDAARLSGVAVAIVMLVSHPGRPWIAAIHRFLEVSFGILIAVLVSMLIWPSRERRKA
jgi:uncharacterized membrane protein YgaE (UPF0421/DUF939 family)